MAFLLFWLPARGRLLVGEEVGVETEEVGVENGADGDELLCVDGLLVEDFLQGTWGDADLLGKPGVGLALAAKFIADGGSDMYLHGRRVFRGCGCKDTNLFLSGKALFQSEK